MSSIDLRTIEGIIYPTYRETCTRLGLLSDDNECRTAVWNFSASSSVLLSHIFATSIAHCFPVDSLQLYYDEQAMLIENIGHCFRRRSVLNDNEEAANHVLSKRQQELMTMSQVTLENLHLPLAPEAFTPLEVEPLQRSPEQLLQKASKYIALFYDRQKGVSNPLLSAVMSGVSTDRLHAEPLPRIVCDRLFFMDATRGTEKTFSLSVVQGFLKSQENTW